MVVGIDAPPTRPETASQPGESTTQIRTRFRARRGRSKARRHESANKKAFKSTITVDSKAMNFGIYWSGREESNLRPLVRTECATRLTNAHTGETLS